MVVMINQLIKFIMNNGMKGLASLGIIGLIVMGIVFYGGDGEGGFVSGFAVLAEDSVLVDNAGDPVEPTDAVQQIDYAQKSSFLVVVEDYESANSKVYAVIKINDLNQNTLEKYSREIDVASTVTNLELAKSNLQTQIDAIDSQISRLQNF